MAQGWSDALPNYRFPLYRKLRFLHKHCPGQGSANGLSGGGGMIDKNLSKKP
jgi:hypothetical protein